MGKITCLNDVIDELHLDMYKRCNMDEINRFEKEIDRDVLNATSFEASLIANAQPFLTYKDQPENIKFFLPPLPELLKELGTSLTEENEGRKKEEEKRKKEVLQAFACVNNLLVAIYKLKNNYICYTYTYDYIDRNEVILTSRIEYR